MDSAKGTIFAVCPVQEGVTAVERCVDSSRYFVLRIENESGRHMFIGLAFNERNDAFDFNTALQDASKERDFEKNAGVNGNGVNGVNGGLPSLGANKDYSLKEGEKITVSMPTKQNQFATLGLDGNTGTAAFADFQAEFDDLSMNGDDIDNDIPSSPTDEPRKLNFTTPSAIKKKKSRESGGSAGGFQLKPSKKDTPARTHM